MLEHVLTGLDCWCGPYRDGQEAGVVFHNDINGDTIMAKQTGTFIDDSRLHGRDNSGGPWGPKQGGEFGGAGKSVGGEPSNGGAEDEFQGSQRGNIVTPRPPTGKKGY